MKVKTIEDRFIYCPDRRLGEALFQGEYRCDENLAKIVGEEGIEYIKNKIQDIIKNKKEMFGEQDISHYGLTERQRFYDLQNRIMIDMRDAMLPENNIITIRESATGKRLKNESNIAIYELLKGIRM